MLETLSDEIHLPMKRSNSIRNADTCNIWIDGRIPCVNLSIGIWDEHERYNKFILRQVFHALGVVRSYLENQGRLTESLHLELRDASMQKIVKES